MGIKDRVAHHIFSCRGVVRVSHGKRTSNKSNRNKQRKNEEHLGMKTTGMKGLGLLSPPLGGPPGKQNHKAKVHVCVSKARQQAVRNAVSLCVWSS